MPTPLVHLGQLFVEDFKSPFSVAENSGTASNKPTISSGMTIDANTQNILYSQSFPNLDDFTIMLEGAFNLAGSNDYSAMFYFRIGTGVGENLIRIFKSPTVSRLTFRIADGVATRDCAMNSGYNIPTNKCVIHLTRSGNTMKIYVDGVLQGTTTGGSTVGTIPISQATTKAIGYGVHVAAIKGRYDNVELWNREFTAQEVQDSYANSTLNYLNKFKCYAPLQDQIGASTFTTSDVVRGNDLTVTNATKLSGRNGYSSAGSARLASSQNLFEDTGKITVAAWCRLGDKASTQAITSYEDSALDVGGLILYYHTGGQYFFYTGSSSSPAIFNELSGQPELAFIVGTYDGTNTSIYVNGVKGTDSASPTAPEVTSDMLLNAFVRGNNVSQKCASGTEVYAVGVADFALTETQILDLFNKGPEYLTNK